MIITAKRLIVDNIDWEILFNVTNQNDTYRTVIYNRFQAKLLFQLHTVIKKKVHSYLSQKNLIF